MRKLLLLCAALAGAAAPARAAQLRPETSAAFDLYVQAVEARMNDDISQNRFLLVDLLSGSRQRAAYEQLQKGHLYLEALHTREDGRELHVPDGLVNHWAGVVFIPGAKLSGVLAVLCDYNHLDEIFKPQIRRSKLLAQNGNHSTVYFQLYSKTVVTVVLNADFSATDTQFGPARYQIALHSNRVAEVADADKPDEHELPVGNDHGYLWSICTYWRIEEKDGGVYLQNESVTLSRSVPLIFEWLLSSLTNGIPRDILTHLLTAARNAVTAAHAE